jgi:hypothetical protein
MKIQERASIPDTRQQRNQDADCLQDSFVSEVPQLDLAALCDEKSWEGKRSLLLGWLSIAMHREITV